MVSRKILLQRARLMAGILVLLVGTIPAQGLAQSSRIKDLLRKVDPARIYTDVLDLAALGTRFSASSEFKKATELVRKKLVQAGLRPTLVPFDLPPVRVNNVVVTFPGTRPGAPLLLASAHYDSFSFDPGGVAPGAEDNGSGTAGLLEMARVLAGEKLATGVSLVFFAGEESGLVGSRHMVKDLKSQGKLGTVQAVLNMDMIGYDPGRTRRMVVDAFGVSRGLASSARAAGALAASGDGSTRNGLTRLPALIAACTRASLPDCSAQFTNMISQAMASGCAAAILLMSRA